MRKTLMQTFIFDVMDGPSLEFSERRAFPSLEAARAYALALAAAAPAEWADVEGWLVRLCDHDSFVLDEIEVAEAAAPAAPVAECATAQDRELTLS
jgi:hypothetical protein